MVLLIIAIILFVLSIIADIICSHYRNKLAKVTKKNTEVLMQQNQLLWAALKESCDISKELMKQNLKKDGGKSNE